MKTKNLMVVLLIGFGLQIALAKELPQKITISGPGLAQEIEITDNSQMITALMSMQLEDYTTRTSEAPEGISAESYLISRYVLNADEEYVLLDASRYYRSPNSEAAQGYLYYEGRINQPSEYDNQWYIPDPANEAILLSLIDNHESEPATRELRAFAAFFQIITMFFAA